MLELLLMNPQQPQYKIIVGLGNPGKEYENTYHNVGFLAVDYFADKIGHLKAKKMPAKKIEFSEYHHILFVKPQTYMNESGIAIKNALQYFKATPEELLVIHDDSDIAIGEYKLSFERGAGGHRGIESAIKYLRTKKFWRLRIGIRPPVASGAVRKKAEEFVLTRISPPHQKLLMATFASIAKEIDQL